MTAAQARQRLNAMIELAKARSRKIKIKYDLSKLTKEDWLAIRELRRRARVPGGGLDPKKLTPEDWLAIRKIGHEGRVSKCDEQR